MAPAPPPEACTGLRLRLLGAPAWRDARDPAWRALARKDAALLALLVLEGAQPRQRVAELLWSEVDAGRALANLRQRLFRLRQAGGLLVTEAEQHLALASGVSCDLRLGLELADPPVLGGGALAACIDAWCAPLLGNASYDTDGPALAHWVDARRSTWSARLPGQLAELATGLEKVGALAAAIVVCERMLQLDPLLEHGWRRLMRLHHGRGDRGAAVAAFERCERVLRDELGLRPGPETLALLAEVEALGPAGAADRPPRPAPLPPGLLRPPRLIGRHGACQAMQASWEEASAFLLVGHAGVGKSRLLAEWAGRHPGAVLCGAMPGDDATPYGLVARVLRATATAGLGPPAGGLPQGVARELARLLPDHGPAPVSPGHPALLQDAVLRWLEAAAASGLRALLLDDLQHADGASLQWLPALAAGAPALRWGLASRPSALAAGPLADWADGSGRPRLVPLDGLDHAALAELLASLPSVAAAAPSAAELAAWAQRLAAHCGGNPLFVLETLRALHRQGITPGGDGPLPLPSSVERLLEQRLAALSPHALALAQVAALVGSEFDAGLAAEVLGSTALSLAAPWKELEAAQLLVGVRMAHETVAEALRCGLAAPVRSQLHSRLARALAARHAAPDRVCQHHAEAGEWPAAARAALRAARQAMIRGRRDVEWTLRLQAATWWSRAGDEQAAFTARVDALEPQALHLGLDPASAEAERLAAQAPDPAALAGLCLARMQLALWRGDGRAAAGHAGAGLAVAAEPTLRLRLQLGQAAGLASAGEPARAQHLSDPLRPLLDAQSDPLAACALWDLQAQVDHYSHRPLDCLQATERMLAAARQAGHVEAELGALGTLTGLYDMLGRGADALATGRAARSLHRRLGDSLTSRAQDLNLAYALFGSGCLGEALELLESTLAYAARTAPASLLHEACQDMLADLWLALGEPAKALAQISDDGGTGSLARRVHRIDLRARAELQRGDAAAASARWKQLDGLLDDQIRGPLHLRIRCHASQRLPAVAAQQACSELLARAEALPSPVGRALARLYRGLAAWRAGDRGTAAGDAQHLLSLLEGPAPLRHGYLDPLQACALAVDAGLQSRAMPLALDWLHRCVLAQTPQALQARLRARWPQFCDGAGGATPQPGRHALSGRCPPNA